MLNWNAHRIDEAITEVHLLLKDAASVLAILKHNVTQTRSILASWATPQPFDRKEGKVGPPCSSMHAHAWAWRQEISTRHTFVLCPVVSAGSVVQGQHMYGV